MALSDHPMWRKPQHHSELEHAHDHVHWIELFYDLVHVVAIFLLGGFLSHHLGLEGFVLFVFMFTAIWFAWADSSAFNSLYVSTDMNHRLIMAAQICTVMVIAASIPSIEGFGWTTFALGYAANRALTALLYWRARRHSQSAEGLAYEMARNFWVLAGYFAICAFLPKPFAYWAFGAGIVAIQLLYMLPKIGVLRFERFMPRLGHMAERFALLLLIVLGEGFFKLVVTLAEKGVDELSVAKFVNFVLGGFAIFVLCWIYFDFVGNAKPKDTKKTTMVTWWLSHWILMLSGVMIGVALTGEVKVGFLDPYPFGYGVLGCAGLAVYLTALLVIQYCVERRVAHEFATWGVRMLGVGLALLILALVPYVPAVVGNALWSAALFSQIIVPLIRARRKFSNDDAPQETS